MTLARLAKWDTELFPGYLASIAATPFAWGSNDCCTFAAGGIQAITGIDVMADFRGKYTDEAGALAAIESVCGGTTVADAAAYCAQKAGLVELPKPLFAQRGDLVVCNAPSGQLVAGLVHLNGRQIVIVGENGLYRVPLRSAVRSWHY